MLGTAFGRSHRWASETRMTSSSKKGGLHRAIRGWTRSSRPLPAERHRATVRARQRSQSCRPEMPMKKGLHGLKSTGRAQSAAATSRKR
jgi:hypothetical protein